MGTTDEIQIEKLYKDCFPAVAAFVKSHGGCLDDAKDVFHDAIITLFEQSERRVGAIKNYGGYIFTISKNEWIKRRSAGKSDRDISIAEEIEGTQENIVSENRVLQLLQASGQRCLELLQSFYYERLSTADICKRHGYRTAHSATVSKYKCLESLRKVVSQKTLQYEDFVESN